MTFRSWFWHKNYVKIFLCVCVWLASQRWTSEGHTLGFFPTHEDKLIPRKPIRIKLKSRFEFKFWVRPKCLLALIRWTQFWACNLILQVLKKRCSHDCFNSSILYNLSKWIRGCCYSSVDLSVPSILPPRVRVPSTPSMLFQFIFVIWIGMWKERK